MAQDPHDGLSRRAALGLVLATGSAWIAGCRREPAARGVASFPLSSLPEGAHVGVRVGEQPIELVRHGRTVEARSLWCTHMGCEVRWRAQEERYHCPCHGGIYDASGAVVSGPPPAPLRRLEVHIAGDRVELPTVGAVPADGSAP